jgi:hypothetical protein
MGNGGITKCCKKSQVNVNIAAAALRTIETKAETTPNGFGRLYTG